MRADVLAALLPDTSWEHVDSASGFRESTRFFMTMAFRARSGPLVHRFNQDVKEKTKKGQYDLVWVDKGVYLWPKTMAYLRKRSTLMVHFTPDAAFLVNGSRHFRKTASNYDLLVTTKSFEINHYKNLVSADRVLLTTQAYDRNLHRPLQSSGKKRKAAVFIGLCEPDRETCMDSLLSHDVPVRLGGRGWSKFLRRHRGNENLHFLGEDVFGVDYVREYSSSAVGLGLLSKRFPELHTTRTFEIPACGALLATERNQETAEFFDDDQVLFFESYEQLARDLKSLLEQPGKLMQLANNGHRRVISGGFDYSNVLQRVLDELAISD